MHFRAGDPIIQIERADVYNGYSRVLHGICLTFRKGEHVALLGPNGAGKTSLIKLISGQLRPMYREDSIPCRIFGRERWNIWELRSHLGIVTPELQQQYHRRITGREVILSGFFGTIGLYQPPTNDQQRQADRIIRMLDLRDVVDNDISQLSTGEARRCIIGRALVHEPDALLLDEPTSGLDIKASASFCSVLRRLVQSGTTLILATHHVEDIIPEINILVLLKGGRIVECGEKDKLMEDDVLSNLFDVPLQIHQSKGRYRTLVK